MLSLSRDIIYWKIEIQNDEVKSIDVLARDLLYTHFIIDMEVFGSFVFVS